MRDEKLGPASFISRGGKTMKTRIFVLLALFVSLAVFPGLASGEAREAESASSSAMFNPLTYVETHYDLGLRGAISVAISLDGKHVYAVGYEDDVIAVFSRNSTTGMLAFGKTASERRPGNGRSSVGCSQP
jgi:hypothetical protein